MSNWNGALTSKPPKEFLIFSARVRKNQPNATHEELLKAWQGLSRFDRQLFQGNQKIDYSLNESQLSSDSDDDDSTGFPVFRLSRKTAYKIPKPTHKIGSWDNDPM